MSETAHSNIFTEVVNELMQELHALPHSTDIIRRLLAKKNMKSPVVPQIQHLSLSGLTSAKMDALAYSIARLSGLQTLTLSSCELDDEYLKFLFTHPALSNLQSLTVCDAEKLMSRDLHLLSQSSTLTNLTSLTLQDCCSLMFLLYPPPESCGDGFSGFGSFGEESDNDWDDWDEEEEEDESGLVALLSSPILENLTHLDLSHNSIDDSIIFKTIASSQYLSNLVSLNLSHHDSLCFLSSSAAKAFAKSTILGNITHLDLSHCELNDEWVAKVFTPHSPLAQKLQSLNLSNNISLTVSSLQVLLKACPHLTELNLAGNFLVRPAGAALIATSMPKLTKLNLTGCRISDEGYAALAASTTLTHLRELDLSDNQGRAQSVVALVNSPIMANLTHLSLRNTHKGPEVLTAIAQSPSLSRLQHLNFSCNGAGEEAIIALAQSKTLTNLISLGLNNSGIGPDGIKALCTSPVVSKLTLLDLSYNEVGNSVASVLAAHSSTLYSLTELFLSGTGLDDEGVLQLLKSPNLDQLDVLMVSLKPNSSMTALHRARFDG
jgi:Ran GTPase-activating protein (RanGAP) involved in mRNA processing and transport